MEQLQRIEHIVILMLENRSFDHMLGFLSPARVGRGTWPDRYRRSHGRG